jgi:RNA polymerase sigma-70 factor (ECF subfamily)
MADGDFSPVPRQERQGATSVSLLERAQEGQPVAWSRLLELYTPLVLWWCRGRGLPPHDAEDIVSEVFAALLARLGDFHRQRAGSFRAWLRCITHNKVSDFYRRRQRELAQGAGGSEALERLHELPADPGEESPVNEDEERSILSHRAIELVQWEFEPRTWEIAMRVAVRGQRPNDVAEEFGVSVGAVYSAKSRVLTRLRSELKGLVE